VIPDLVTPLDPLHGDGYQWWSGVGSGSPLLAAVLVYLRKHNCHVQSGLTPPAPAMCRGIIIV
jgi:hypothetical protein